MRALLQTWNTPPHQQSQVLIKYLGGEAKREVLVMPEEERQQANDIFARLHETYEDKVPAATLLQMFHSRRQKSTETIREFSLALQEILGRLKQRDPEALIRPDLLLRDRLVAGLANRDVQRILRMEIRRTPDISFREVTREALHLSADRADTQKDSSAGVNASSAVSAQSPSLRTLQTAPEETVKQQREMSEKMADMKLELTQLRSASASQNRRPRRQPRWDEQGSPICFICDRSGHMARDCPQRRPPQNQSHYQGPPKPPAQLNQDVPVSRARHWNVLGHN
ncbi:uncharacterized protein LOC119732083 [Patiria miniata]|uniref:CCHC-type domain-containing protein n=1 Tax=Patiria miniata TaxID=46514 RepID=A0A914AC20_PATMI|nr:uncharacterized protein LOC119732083 [Patiria miniata]